MFERLRKFGITINLNKFVFGATEVRYLGYLISKSGTRPLPDRALVLQEFQRPTTVTELRQFLGVINFYRRFLKNAAAMQALLHALLTGFEKNKASIEWSQEAEGAFQDCKSALSSTILLHHSKEDYPRTVM